MCSAAAPTTGGGRCLGNFAVNPQAVSSYKSHSTGPSSNAGKTRLSVTVSFAVNVVETVALGIAAWVTSSVALRAQTATNAAEVAVQVFLLIGVRSSVWSPDQSHPLGYG